MAKKRKSQLKSQTKKTSQSSKVSETTGVSTKKDVYEFGVFNLAVPPNIREKQDISKLITDFVPFGDDNLMPQYLSELKRQSSTHRSVLAQKTIFTSGARFVTNNDNLKEYIKDVNADGESLRDVFKKLSEDFYTFGNSYLEGVLYDGGVNLYHIDATTVRMNKDKKSVMVHPDWANYRNMKDEMVHIPIYPNTSESRFVLHFSDYEPTFQYYGLPDYVAALEHIAVDYEIGKWNHTKFKNGFQPSAIIEISGDMGAEEAKKMVSEFQSKLTGEGKNGKLMFIVKNGDTSPANVQIIKDDQEGSWIDLQRITDQNIVTAHRWQPSLSGLVSSGKMNNTGSEIRISYDLAMTTVIKDTSDRLLDGIKKVLWKEMGIESHELSIHFEPPISFAASIDVTKVLTINEQRRLLDESLGDLDDGDVFISVREQIAIDKANETDDNKNNEE
tara:strand:- start:153 stop:1487 length:1335 start_codon:yes stop_codon:yes gene_type:complete